MRVCTICNHAERSKLDECLVSGQSLRNIAKQFGVGHSALHRHRDHIPKALTAAKQASEVADATTLLDRVERLVSRCETICEKAMAEGEWTPAVSATRELRGCLELIGKLSGELKQPGVNIGIQANFAELSVKDFSDQQLRDVLDMLMERVGIFADDDGEEEMPIELTNVERLIRAGFARESDAVQKALADKEKAIADYQSRKKALPATTIQGVR